MDKRDQEGLTVALSREYKKGKRSQIHNICSFLLQDKTNDWLKLVLGMAPDTTSPSEEKSGEQEKMLLRLECVYNVL